MAWIPWQIQHKIVCVCVLEGWSIMTFCQGGPRISRLEEADVSPGKGKFHLRRHKCTVKQLLRKYK